MKVYSISPCPSNSLDVGDSDARARRRHTRQSLAVLLDVEDVRARGANGAARGPGGCTGEGDRAEVSKGHERVALLEVLDDPLRVLLAERAGRGDRLRHALAVAVVRDDRRAVGGGGCGDGQSDAVAGAEADAGEVVGVVGVPLVPCWAVIRYEEVIRIRLD